MPEKPTARRNPEKKSRELPETGAWSADRRARGYYYDDACGYEIFDPAADADDDSETAAGELSETPENESPGGA